jgi:hypothetical protein
MQANLTIAAARDRFADRFAEFRNKGLHLFKHWGYGSEAREECVANAMLLAWHRVVDLVCHGKANDKTLASTLYYACKQTRSGRAPQNRGMNDVTRSRDIYSAGNAVSGGIDLDAYVADRMPIPDIVAFRIDTREWLDSLTPNQRSRAIYLASGASTTDCAREWGVTTAAVSFYRRQLNNSYLRFHGD